MRIMIIDDNPHALNRVHIAVQQVCPDAKIDDFTSPREALKSANEHVPDIVFLDVEMPGMNGLVLGKSLKDMNPAVRLVFCTGYKEYAVDAMHMHASGYLLKPITEEDIKKEFDAMKQPAFVPYKRDITIRTFGTFEVFSGEKPVDFKRNKAKEALAILVDNNGSLVRSETIANMLWGDDVFDISRQKQLYTIISDMRKAIDSVGAYDVILKGSKGYAIDRSKVDCDYFRMLSGDPAIINQYNGRYMDGYAWAELSETKIERLLDQN